MGSRLIAVLIDSPTCCQESLVRLFLRLLGPACVSRNVWNVVSGSVAIWALALSARWIAWPVLMCQFYSSVVLLCHSMRSAGAIWGR